MSTSLFDVATGKTPHLYAGRCPDSVNGPESRDPDCPACQAISAAAQQERLLQDMHDAGREIDRVMAVDAETVDRAWARFCGAFGDGPDAPYPGMIAAFETHYGQSFRDKEWRTEAACWAAAWSKATARAESTLAEPQPDAGLIGVQWWLAELDLYGNPALADGAHSDRAGADKAMYLFKALHLDAGRRFAVARVELSEPKPRGDGVNHEAIKTLNDARREAQP